MIWNEHGTARGDESDEGDQNELRTQMGHLTKTEFAIAT